MNIPRWRLRIIAVATIATLAISCGSEIGSPSADAAPPAAEQVFAEDSGRLFPGRDLVPIPTENLAEVLAAAQLFTVFDSLEGGEFTSSHGFHATWSDIDQLSTLRGLQITGLQKADREAGFWVINLIGPAQPVTHVPDYTHPTAYYWAILDDSTGILVGTGKEADLPVMLTHELAVAAAKHDLATGMLRN